MFRSQDSTETSHKSTVEQKGSIMDNKQTGTKSGLGTKIIECLKRVASGGSIPNMGQILNLSKTTPQYSLNEVRGHSDSSSCWIVVDDNVYDVTEFLNQHPGGEEIILENAGSDATIPFESKGHSRDAKDLLREYCIGELRYVRKSAYVFAPVSKDRGHIVLPLAIDGTRHKAIVEILKAFEEVYSNIN